jgi:hypothetical protein
VKKLQEFAIHELQSLLKKLHDLLIGGLTSIVKQQLVLVEQGPYSMFVTTVP